MGLRQNVTAGTLVNTVIGPKRKMLSMSIDIPATDYQIDANFPPLLYLNPDGGAKDVLLPVEADAQDQMFTLVNTADAAENIVLKDDSDTTTIATLNQGDTCTVHCDGTTWRQIGGDA